MPAIFGHCLQSITFIFDMLQTCIKTTFEDNVAKAFAATCARQTVCQPLLVFTSKLTTSSSRLPTLRQLQWCYEQ
jgi:hypothetical protein